MAVSRLRSGSGSVVIMRVSAKVFAADGREYRSGLLVKLTVAPSTMVAALSAPRHHHDWVLLHRVPQDHE